MTTQLTLAPWKGGKAKMVGRLLALFPPHRCYVEPFGGMASVLLNKAPVETEVYNDRDTRLVGLFACIKFHHEAFDRELAGLLKSRQLFESFLLQPGLTDIQKAARFLYCQSLGFGGQGETYGVQLKSGGTRIKTIDTVRAMAARIHARIQTVSLEHLDWEEVLDRYDSPETFFFLDPPYLGTDGYAVPFATRDHQVLAEKLRAIRGRFLMTNSDCRELRDLFRGFRMTTLRTPLGVSLDHSRKLVHLVVTNYEPGTGAERSRTVRSKAWGKSRCRTSARQAVRG